ncbi:glycoprotein-N-acetylgalactosamine 3-beta-galactosyltransferase 1 [Drosophila eugracilis]|uniref:glycoprotein-N-acetylgalactosamine 3-beta-galactosyltransferase 1 n=1 Tax=Drosophila eugracilis TaxID=29029 RepID=UPI0007E88122|nr:glycoprotein-N-acetylgalactosamine 3-beta-galactosyltransferase 1 [Drosophila eugracilis]
MYRNILCLALGLIIGIRLTDFFEYFQLTRSDFGSTPITQFDDEATPQLATEEALARWLHNETRVLCMVLTTPKNHLTRGRRVKGTWGKRCNKLIFISTLEDRELGAIDVGVPEERKNLYLKMRIALDYVYQNYGEDYDWFLKADDDTFVIMENLRLLLYPYDPEAALYFGHRFRSSFPQGYMSGGAGYVMSRDALRRLNLFAFNNTHLCPINNMSEDRQIGFCLQNVGVVAGDSRDEEGRDRFLPLSLKSMLPSFPTDNWLHKLTFYEPANETGSTSGISFHYVKNYEFEMYEFLLYRLRVFGHPLSQRSLPPRLEPNQMQNQLYHWSLENSTNPNAWLT